jgi:hypothetical protein
VGQFVVVVQTPNEPDEPDEVAVVGVEDVII